MYKRSDYYPLVVYYVRNCWSLTKRRDEERKRKRRGRKTHDKLVGRMVLCMMVSFSNFQATRGKVLDVCFPFSILVTFGFAWFAPSTYRVNPWHRGSLGSKCAVESIAAKRNVIL